jgi:hypothetical protein
LDGGVWKELLMKVAAGDKASDSLAIVTKKDLNMRLLINAAEEMLKNEKMLTILDNEDIESLERGKNAWRVILRNKKRYDVRAIVDASQGEDLRNRTKESLELTTGGKLRPVEELQAADIRTIVAIAEYGQIRYALPVQERLKQQVQNIFFIHSLLPNIDDVETIPLRAHMGQAVGAAAAYCAFFKTDAQKIDVRKLQTELIGFRARLLPWANIAMESPNYMSIQKAFLTTLFGENELNKQPEFTMRDSIHTGSVREIFNKYYSRSQLWFLDNDTDYFSLADLLSLIKMVSFRGDEIDSQIQKDWNKKLHFDGEYNLDHTVNHYEFAVLVDQYANPFSKTVSQDGTILR